MLSFIQFISEQQQQRRHQFKWMHRGDTSREYALKKKVKPEIQKAIDDKQKQRVLIKKHPNPNASSIKKNY